MATRQQLEQQLVAAHRSGNVQAAQQAAYAIRAYDQNSLSAQVPSVNAPPPIERVPKPTFGDYFEDISRGMGRGFVTQLEGMQQLVTHPYDTGKALIQAGVEAVRNPAQAIGEAWSGIKSQAKTAMSSPEGFGRVLGENLDFIPGPGGKRRPTMAELDVYHGTPHTFEPEEGAPLGRFRSSKIGTGEGAQAYGYGLYLAEHPDVAGQYRQIAGHQGPFNAFLIPDAAHPELQDLSHKASLSGNYTAAWVYDELLTGDFGPEQLLRKASKEQLPAVREALANAESVFKKHKGSLYKVDLPDAKIEQMLDWDKPLSEQSENVRNALKRRITDVQPIDKFDMGGGSRLRDNRAGQYDKTKPYPWILEANSGNGTSAFGLTQKDVDRMFGGKDASSLTGEQIISRLAVTQGSQAAASEYLRSLGIPGIKYLDAGSRDGGKGTRNFVVFPGEEQNLTILERDGVKAEVPKAAAPKVRQFSPASLASVKVGGKVDGYTVRADVPNTDSIGATLDDYEVLSGIRSVPMSDFDPEYVRSISMDKLDARTRRLADEIQQSKELSPMIVAYDAEGPYIIEGGHRFDALIASKAKSIPAVVVIDKSNPPK